MKTYLDHVKETFNNVSHSDVLLICCCLYGYGRGRLLMIPAACYICYVRGRMHRTFVDERYVMT